MTPSQEPESDQNAGGRRPWLAVGLTVGAGLLVLGGAAGVAGWVWSRNHLMPWLSAYLSEVVGRPVELGPLERLGPTGIRVGASTLPPTATDPDRLSVGAIEVRVNPLDLLRRDIRLGINLEQVEAYIEQAADGQWVAIELDLPETDPDRKPFIEVMVGAVRLQDGSLTLLPYGTGAPDRPQIAIADIQGQGDISRVDLGVDPNAGAAVPLQTQRIDLTLNGTSVKGGRVDIKGAVQLPPPKSKVSLEGSSDRSAKADAATTRPEFLAWLPPGFLQALVLPAAPAWASGDPAQPNPGLMGKVNLRAQDVQAIDIMPLVESFLAGPLPVQFPTGLVSGSVDVELGGEVTPTLTGTARVSEATVTGATLPEPLQDLQGDVRFQGQSLAFEAVTARMGDLTAKAGGTLDLKKGYDLAGQVNPFTIAQVADLVETTLPVPASGTFGAKVTMTGPLNQPVIATDLVSQDSVTIDKVVFSQVRAKGRLRAPNLILDQVVAIPQAGGALNGSGRFTFGEPGQLSLALTGDRLPADALGQTYGLSKAVTLGPVSFEAEVAGPVNQLVGIASWRAPAGTYPARGDLRLEGDTLRFTDTFVQVAGGTVAGQGMLANGQWNADVIARELRLRQLGAGVDGVVNAAAQLSGNLKDTSLAGIQGRGRGELALAGGTVVALANLASGQWTADVEGRDLQMRAFAPDLQGSAGGQFTFTGTTDDLSLAGVRGEGQAVLSDGLATAAPRAPQLARVREPLIADLAWNGQSVLVRQANTAGIRAAGIVTPALSGPGAPAIANLDLNLNVDGFSLAALPVPDVIPLGGEAFFAGRLRGRPGALDLNGEASLVGFTTGELAFASPLSGPVTFRQGGDLVVDLTGSGDNRIYVATVEGDRDLEFEVVNDLGHPDQPHALATGYLRGDNLAATIQNLPLTDLKLPQGGVDGVGTVSGLITSAEIAANLRLPTLRATFDIEDPGLGYLSLPPATVATIADSAALDSPVELVEPVEPDSPLEPDRPAEPDAPVELETRYGRLRGTVTYADSVVSLVGVALESASGKSRYLASGTYTLAKEPQLKGELVVENGQIQDILSVLMIFERADFRANLLKPPEWFRPATEADLASLEEVNPVGDRNASLLDQLRRLAEVLELQDLLAANASESRFPSLEEFTGGLSGKVTARGPLSKDLEVTFDLAGADWVWGDPATTNGSSYRISEVIAQGRYQDSILEINPVSLRSDFSEFSAATQTGVALATLNGEFSFDPADPVERTLRLEVSDVPISAVRQPLQLPKNLDGLVNLGATLTGTLDNPQVRGQLAVNEATINRQEIDLAAASFGYHEARLNVLGRIAIQEQIDPLLLSASVPLLLPGVNQRPASDAIDISLKMRDEGFALINLLTQAITWESGSANLDLAVQGRWPADKPIQEALTTLNVTGAANFDGVTISSNSLPEPLTNIQGSVQVVEQPETSLASSVYGNGLVLDFQEVTGDFSNGKVVADGNLKLLPSVQDLAPGLFNSSDSALAPEDSGGAGSPAADSLRITLDNIALDLRNPAGTYRGLVDGAVVVGGSVFLLPPLVQGQIQLSNGILTLPEVDAPGATPVAFATNREPSIFQPIPPEFKDFQLVLADNVRLAVPGFVDVRAEGSLDLVGAAPNLKPSGRINLPSGRINLLTTVFRLTGNENYAEFSDLDDTIDPYLVATLTAVVSGDAAAGNTLVVATPFPTNETSVSPISELGLTQLSVQGVRIRANVNGRASRVIQLQDVKLSSTPARSEGEIITLISGGLLVAVESTLGGVSGGGDGLQGLLSFAGSALLNSFVGDGLDRVDLRLFSASPQGAQQGGALDIGGELGFSVSPNLSISVQQVFTSVSPALFSLRYRISDQVTVRGITSYEQFSENTGIVLEFGF